MFLFGISEIKSYELKQLKRGKYFFLEKLFFLYPIDLDVYYDKSMYTILNLLKVMLIFWWFKFEISFIKIMILISWNNIRLPLMIILIHEILDSWLDLLFVYEMVEIFVPLNYSLLLSIFECYMLNIWNQCLVSCISKKCCFDINEIGMLIWNSVSVNVCIFNDA